MTSTYHLGTPQADGRIPVREVHVDETGKQHVYDYLGEANTDFGSVMQSRAVQLAAQLATPESRELLKVVLDGQIGEGTYDMVKAACVAIGAEVIILDSTQIDVRVSDPVIPDEPDLQAAYESLGGNFAQLKAAVKALGFSVVTLSKKSKITL